MSNQLIESIIDDNLVEANEIFNDRINDILECKLYEAKRMLQADLNEAKPGGGLTTSEIEARRKAGYRPASQVLGGTETEKSPAAKRLASQQKAQAGEGDIRAKLSQLGKQWKKAGFGERKKAVSMVQQAAKKFAGTQAEKPAEAPKPTEAPKAGETPRQMPKLDKEKTPRDMSRALFLKSPKALRKPGAPRTMGLVQRYTTGLERAKDLESRGAEGSVKRFKKAAGMRGVAAQSYLTGKSGLAALRHVTRAIQDSSGGVIE